jgi:hypothetical protein
MGAAASISVQDQQKATELVNRIQSKSGSDRVAALKELWNLSENEKYKEALCDPSFPLLSTLQRILDSSSDEETLEAATGILWYLSRVNAGREKIGSAELKLVPVLISFLSKKSTARSHALKTFANVVLNKSSHGYITSPELGFLKTIKEQFRTDGENKTLYFIMSNFAYEASPNTVQLFIDEGIPEILSTKLFAGTGWYIGTELEQCLRFFTRATTTKCGAEAVHSLNRPEFFMKLVHSTGLERVYGAMIMANVYGKEESSSQAKALLASNGLILDLILLIFDFAIHPKDQIAARKVKDKINGFPYGIIGLREVSSSLKNLSISDENKKNLIGNTKLLDFSCEVILAYLSNGPPFMCVEGLGEMSAGGGGSDVDTFENMIEFFLQLSFFYEEDEVLRSYFKKCSFDVKGIMKSISELPIGSSCPFESKQFANLLLKRLDPTLTKLKQVETPPVLEKQQMTAAPETTSAEPTSPTKSRLPLGHQQHIMLSYSWSKNKPHVIALGKKLRDLGYDVWRDEEGSNIFPSMQGDIEDAMAEAIQKSYAMVVFVSQQYKESVNCRAEAKYARAREANGFLKLIYVMVDENYHTRSSPRAVDGWLGFMVGSDLWYPLWQMNQVEQTAGAIADLVGENAKTGIANGGAMQSPVLINPMTTSLSDQPKNNQTAAASASSATSAVTPLTTTRDFQTGWDCLSDPKKTKDSAALASLLDEYGVYSLKDLIDLDVEYFEALAVLLKPAPQKCFRKALNF